MGGGDIEDALNPNLPRRIMLALDSPDPDPDPDPDSVFLQPRIQPPPLGR
ncbi:MAG: hypothetical protein ACOX52_07175 [Verrucomicrobiota bacterium]